MDTGAILTFVIVSFSLALVVIMKRESIPPPFRKILAISSLVMVGASFIMLTYAIYRGLLVEQ